jgi:hypothetical protein
MTDFSDDWLALRAPADRRARADGLLEPLLANWPMPRQVLDLAAGTGANLRHLAPRLGEDQRWVCVDHDPALLARLPSRTAEWAAAAGHDCDSDDGALRCCGNGWSCRIETQRLDLVAQLDSLEMPAGGLVTASALLDLVSEYWLERLLTRAAAAGCRLLFALSYDGRCRLEPSLPDDHEVIALVNRHRRGDKGFGPALGPDAAEIAASMSRKLGYWARTSPSDWQIGPYEPTLQRALLDGWTQAALDMAPNAAAAIRTWRQMREQAIRAGRLQIGVGHVDLVARSE